MIHAREWARPRRAQSLRYADTDKQATGEAGSARYRDQTDVVRARIRTLESEVEQMGQALEVVARGQLGDDPTEVFVQVDLRMDDVGQDPAATLNQRDRSLVAAGFDSEDQPLCYWGSPFVSKSRRRPRTSASIRSRLASYARRNRGEWIESDHITMASSPLSV